MSSTTTPTTAASEADAAADAAADFALAIVSGLEFQPPAASTTMAMVAAGAGGAPHVFLAHPNAFTPSARGALRPCCVGCVREMEKDASHRCVRDNRWTKCKVCQRKRRPCEVIPAVMIPELRRLQENADHVVEAGESADPDYEVRKTVYGSCVREFNRAMLAYNRRRRRHLATYAYPVPEGGYDRVRQRLQLQYVEALQAVADALQFMPPELDADANNATPDA
ncbi:MAG: hypothetical protein M1826_000981 [Phylliscum demangeonii]|nr:MAG: hypothetical protein M1826_000981 [Phylliscum demangeonii]